MTTPKYGAEPAGPPGYLVPRGVKVSQELIDDERAWLEAVEAYFQFYAREYLRVEVAAMERQILYGDTPPHEDGAEAEETV